MNAASFVGVAFVVVCLCVFERRLVISGFFCFICRSTVASLPPTADIVNCPYIAAHPEIIAEQARRSGTTLPPATGT